MSSSPSDPEICPECGENAFVRLYTYWVASREEVRHGRGCLSCRHLVWAV